jgi:predicted transcriptional regulator
MVARPNQIAIELPPELRQRVDDLAKRQYTTRAAIIRAAIVEYVTGHETAKPDEKKGKEKR